MLTLRCLTMLLIVQSVASATPHILVPRTTAAIMIDGTFSVGEWDQAAQVDIPGRAKLYFQRSADFLYIAVRYTKSPSGMVDLYLSPEVGEVYDFHASAKLGERELKRDKFSDWNWWNNRDWTANVSRIDSFEKRTFLPTRIREYQIRLSRFSSRTWRVRFELTAMGVNNETQAQMVFPHGTSDRFTVGWLDLALR